MTEFGESLREALSRLRRAGAGAPDRAGATVGANGGAPAPGAGAPAPRPVASWLQGREIASEAGRCFLHERRHSALEPCGEKRAQFRAVAGRREAFESARAHRDLIEAARRGLDRSFLLDLETTGFASTPIFLAGCLVPHEEDFLLLQYFARDYAEEKALIAAVSEALSRADVLITFNGKSYDLPLIRDRAAMHGVRWREPDLHLDLLHHARRRYKSTLPDCRLGTLEWACFGRKRHKDVHGSEIPRLYHDYVRSGDFEPLLPVFHHNIFDLLTLSSLVGDLLLAEPLPARRARAAGPPGTRIDVPASGA